MRRGASIVPFYLRACARNQVAEVAAGSLAAGSMPRPGEVAHAKRSKLDVASMVLKAQVSCQRFLAKLRNGRLVDVDDQLAVERHLDPRSVAGDVDGVPLAGPAHGVLPRCHVAVERPAGMGGRWLSRVVEQLDLVAEERRASGPGTGRVERPRS